MTDGTMRSYRRERRDLAARLVVEYAGAVAAGQVFAAVIRADMTASRYDVTSARRLAMCESLARGHLTECIARSAAESLVPL